MPTSPSAPASLAIHSPPDKVPSVPVVTRVQQLPFGDLTWENFERLCHRLTVLDGNVEHCARYGRQGDAQGGIDIYARQTDGRYHCLQAKRHHSFSASKLRTAVDLFLAGSWAERSACFTIAVQASLRTPDVQEEIELQAARLRDNGITFVALDGENLTERLRAQPTLIDDFFGRPWVAALLGQEAADNLGQRLDGKDLAEVRSQLALIYEAHFHSLDPGTVKSIHDDIGRPSLSLLERFLKPDILVRETTRPRAHFDIGRTEDQQRAGSGSLLLNEAPTKTTSNETVESDRKRRVSLAEWFGSNPQRLVISGDAGLGKSTLLRVIALDLLHGHKYFPELATGWGQHIPVYIPFARWSAQVTRDGNQIGIKEIVRRTLEQLLTRSIVDLLDRAIDDGRILLLIDGLDEWSSEQAARTTLNTLITTAEAHDIPAIVSGRPRGLDRIGTLPTSWKRGTIATLSSIQQAVIAGRWFERYAAGATSGTGPSEASLRTGRFMAELARDANLGTLAAVPLLLIGLITLALRGQTLPRTRGDIYDQLVRVLLEDHPVNRATASGDTESRFRHMSDLGQRRAAIARLAYAVREQMGGAGMPLADAHAILRTYLASPQDFDLSTADARAAASELLSVNAETQGLIVEKGPGEVGFVHASFEEFLSAEHVGGWPFSDIEEFVHAHAGDGRWRNVITHLIGRIERRNELDRLVAIIEEPCSDELARYHRQFLLGDIAFGAATRSPTTANRLALATMHRVETDDWLPARREALASVLKGLPDPKFKADIEQRLDRWLPARSSYRRAALIEALGRWQPTPQLQELLFKAMHDEDSGVQRAAAVTYAKAFSSSSDACQRLLDALARTRNLAAAAALLESLALGWPNIPNAASLFEQAWHSHNPDLRLVGILGLAQTGAATGEARDVVLRSQNFWSEVSYPYRNLASSMLIKYWPADEMLVESALRRAHRDFNSIWENDVAVSYLMGLPIDRTDVRAWICDELRREHPFTIMDRQNIWSDVGRFAASDPEIRTVANAFWCNQKNRIINMHTISGYVAQIADPPIATALIEVINDKKATFDRYWALNALLTGWGRDHPDIKFSIDALTDAADDDLVDLVSLLPQIMRDKSVARERLLRMGMRADVRRDLLATGLEACGCDGSDSEAVEVLLDTSAPLRGPFDLSYPLLRAFGTNARVRALAQEWAREADSPLSAIAAAYANDPEFASIFFDAAVPLPVDLRSQVIDVATNGASGTVLEKVLSQCMLETDPDLRARMVIAHHRLIRPEAHDEARKALLAKAVAVGSDYPSVRAAALAGLVTIGALEALARLEDHGKPVALETGDRFMDSVPSIERLVCEHFAKFEASFGDGLADRFKSLGNDNRLTEILSAAPGASSAARTAFLALADSGEIPCTPHALRSLAAERPRSDILLSRCWAALDSSDYRNDRAMMNAEVGLILRENFSGDEPVRLRLVERFKAAPSVVTAIPLAVFAPESEELPLLIDGTDLGHEFGYWTTATHVAASRADSATFCKVLEAMLTRQRRSQFDAQQITNLAVVERLGWDSELEGLLSARIEIDVDPSISGSFARYLAAAGKLAPEARSRAFDLLQELGANQQVPVAGYDAISDQWRALRITLLDAVSAGLELG